MSENEKYLLELAKKGDIDAFEKLIEKYEKKVFNIALKLLGDYDDASETAQEVFLKIFRSLAGFKEQSSFSTWIYRITTNVCFDVLRKRKNNNVVYIDEIIENEDEGMKRQIPQKGDSVEDIVEKKEIKEILNEAIQNLSEEHRTVLVLRDIQGFSYEDISEILNCPEGTVKSRLNRARKALKEILKDKKELFFDNYVKVKWKEG